MSRVQIRFDHKFEKYCFKDAEKSYAIAPTNTLSLNFLLMSAFEPLGDIL